MGKGEIARNKQFHPFPQSFLLKQIIVSPFIHIIAIIFLFDAELEKPKIGLSVKELKERFQNILISPCRSAMFWNFCVGIHRYSALTYDVIKSYLTRVRDKKIRNGYITLKTRVVI